jgi:hypothetical protein
MPSEIEAVLGDLLDDYAFHEVRETVNAEYPAKIARPVRRLCDAAERIMNFDAEDFAEIAGWHGLQPEVSRVLLAASWPRTRTAQPRGALGSLCTTYGLLLEVVEVRLRRNEVNEVLALLHLAAEYLPILAWQAYLGHAADPVRIAPCFGRPDAGWRHESHHCRLGAPERKAVSAAVLTVSKTNSTDQWWSYITRQHSHLAGALAVCGGSPAPNGNPYVCHAQCSVAPHQPTARADLAWRIELCRRFAASPIIRLRHGSPVGHFFAVPEQPGLDEAWADTWAALTREGHGGSPPNPLHGVRATGELAGLPDLFAVVAGGAGSVVKTELLSQLRSALRTLIGAPGSHLLFGAVAST